MLYTPGRRGAVVVYAVIGDFPAMEREHEERIASHRGGSHGKQDLIKIAGCSHSVAPTWRAGPCNCHAPLTEIQLETPRVYEKRKRERKKRQGTRRDGGRRYEASHVVEHRAIFPFSSSFSFCSTHHFHNWSLFLSLPLSFWERPTIVEMGNRLGLREKRRTGEMLARTHYSAFNIHVHFLKYPTFIGMLMRTRQMFVSRALIINIFLAAVKLCHV